MNGLSGHVRRFARSDAAFDRQIISEARGAIARSMQILRDSAPDTYLGGNDRGAASTVLPRSAWPANASGSTGIAPLEIKPRDKAGNV